MVCWLLVLLYHVAVVLLDQMSTHMFVLICLLTWARVCVCEFMWVGMV